MIAEVIHTANRFDTIIGAALKPHGLTHAQFNILRILRDAAPSPLSVSDIRERVLFPNSDITRLIDRLVAKELVSRTVCPANRRKVDIGITESARQLLEVIVPQVDGRLKSSYASSISNAEAEPVSSILKRIQERNTSA